MAEIFLAKLLGADGFERNVVIKRMLSQPVEPARTSWRCSSTRRGWRRGWRTRTSSRSTSWGSSTAATTSAWSTWPARTSPPRCARRARSGSTRRCPSPCGCWWTRRAGLHFAHDFTNEAGQPLHIVHRDISPSNLYVTYQGQVKVLDFGIAKAASRLVQTRTGVVKGKYIYMAPEQAQGKDVDRRADVFSLGVSLYESLTNVRPFARENDLAVLNALLQGDFMPPSVAAPGHSSGAGGGGAQGHGPEPRGPLRHRGGLRGRPGARPQGQGPAGLAQGTRRVPARAVRR